MNIGGSSSLQPLDHTSTLIPLFFLVDVPPSRSLECREQCMQREQWIRAAFR